jgi:ribonuclease P protein component
LSKRGRLKGKQVIKHLFSKGKRFHTGNLTFIYLPAEEPMVGFVASKRIGGAVKRNRVKRLLREAYRMNRHTYRRFDLLIYARGPLERNDITTAFLKFQEVW